MIDIKLLEKLVKIPTYSGSETELGDILQERLKVNGFSVSSSQVEPGRFNIFATKNQEQGKKAILFYGHLDTVSPLPDWQNPCLPIIEGDKLIGLGSYDMKGGIVSFLEATKHTNAYVKIFLAVDEENMSKGAWVALENNQDFFNDVELIISAEPNFGLGLEGITRGRTGRAIFSVNFEGQATHIAKHSEGKDAIKMATSWIEKLYLERDLLFTSTTTVIQVRRVFGESIGMSVCASAEAEVEALLGSTDTIKDVLTILSSLDKNNPNIEIQLKPRETPYLPGYFFESFPYQEQIAQIILDLLGKEMQLHERSSVGDDNVLATLGIPVITWGPDGGNAHTTGEWVSLSSLEKLSQMYKKMLSTISR